MTMEDTARLTSEAIHLLSDMVSIQAYSREEAYRCNYLEQYLKERGQQVHRIGNNLWCEAYSHDQSLPTVLLNSHIDTVPASEKWTCLPFRLQETDVLLPDRHTEKRLYGLGSNDAGAPLVSLVQVYLQLAEKRLPYNLVLGLSCEEEVTGKGGIDLLLTDLPAIDFGLVGEPTSMKAAIAEKGLMVIDCCAHGTTGHAAHNTGDNAIYKAMKAIDWVRTTTVDNDPASPVKSGWDKKSILGPVKMTVTIIDGGTKHNVIPDECRFTIDVRVNDRYENEALFLYIEQHLAEFGCTVQARSFRLSSSGISLQHPAAQRLETLGVECFGSPTLSDQSRMPFPTIKMGPGDTQRSHTADEYIRPEEIKDGIEGYISFLEGLTI